MILVDTSVWVDHLRMPDALLSDLLARRRVLMHPFVLGEIALGSLRQRDVVLKQLGRLPRSQVCKDAEVLYFIDRHTIAGTGVGYVDSHLLAATQLSIKTTILTRDRRLNAVANRIGVAAVWHH